MDYKEMKEIALSGGVIQIGGYCCDGRHENPIMYYKKPVHTKNHSEHGECVVVDADVSLIFKPDESLYDYNRECGACCITTMVKYDTGKLTKDLEQVVLAYVDLGMTLQDILAAVQSAYNKLPDNKRCLTTVEPDTTKIQVVQKDGFSDGGAG